ncbi:fluoroquinolone transport system permease protein [Actinoalloteichus hoggarensis]|uniref:Fluoroquinolones export permease protein n=1 Tax=Actinoalloteichus hoggarensis TaxID=1470176 RepID=A0A221W7M6_9PSEU|nr:fluoroquinolone transporter permease [Actinoalloteichus hoggarensis]ASO21636.1 Fluoroquinolones export permease protein [Actinoalloteichus hoggarensis]MBB5922229.1 fluoroquinolone transport system permease protein [Actinoalloteichus hoggarensis]
MARTFAAFGRNDLRGAGRDTLLVGMCLAPLVWIAAVRFGTPPVTRMLAEDLRFDLVPYHPLIVVGFLLLTTPIVIGGVAALLVLDERDAGTLTAIRVAPVSLGAYIAYRSVTAVGITLIYVLGTVSASGLFRLSLLPTLIPIGVLTGLSALAIALTILAMAKNKVEGLAAIRALGIVVAGLPLLPSFIDSPWSMAFGLLPTYWPAQAFLAVSDGTPWWPYLVGGLVYHLLTLWPLYRRFSRTAW